MTPDIAATVTMEELLLMAETMQAEINELEARREAEQEETE